LYRVLPSQIPVSLSSTVTLGDTTKEEYDEIIKNPKRFKGYEQYRNYFNKNRLDIAKAGVSGIAGAGLLGYSLSDGD